MKIYISLPISGHDLTKAREYADNIKATLSRLGHTPVNPFDIYAGKNPDYFDHLGAGLRALSNCDAIILCKGWQSSKGCQIEKTFAEACSKKIFVELVYLPQNNET